MEKNSNSVGLLTSAYELWFAQTLQTFQLQDSLMCQLVSKFIQINCSNGFSIIENGNVDTNFGWIQQEIKKLL